MRKDPPDRHEVMVVDIQGSKVKFWYLISPADPSVGYDQPYMESCYVTNIDGSPCSTFNVSDEEFDRLKDLAYDRKNDDD